MNMTRRLCLACVMLMACLVAPAAGAADKKEMPKQDVVDVPAIGQGLCVANAFQSNMVLQRDKPIRIWGWAEPGEKVTVSFGDQTQSATVAADRSWKVELPALPASSEPRQLVVQGRAKTIKEMQVEGGRIILKMARFEVDRYNDGPILGFAIAGKDGKFQPAKAEAPPEGGGNVHEGAPRHKQGSS